MFAWLCFLTALAVNLSLGSKWPEHGQMPAPQSLAVVELSEARGSEVYGTLYIKPYPYVGDKRIIIYGNIYNLKPGTHGFHVHEFGSIGNDCMDTGGHFNPHQVEV